jgi:predicted alpha/beta superfamily hydrolase
VSFRTPDSGATASIEPTNDRVSSVRLRDPDVESNGEPIPTWIEVGYPAGRGTIGLRGNHAPLSWEETTKPTCTIGDDHLFCVPLREGELVELKVVQGNDWALGRNYVVHAGDHIRLEPCFDDGTPSFVRDIVVSHQGKSARIDVLLPPSYEEQSNKRYPVLYVLDGQSLWTHSQDPFGTWGLDATLGSLYELGAVEEMIVVGIHTSEDRLALLGPVPDAHHGGGDGEAFLGLVVDGIRAHVNERFRTLDDAASTGILGSSMGGLFAFFAAWMRPDIFGKAVCLSSSFWWADRWAIRLVQSCANPPEPRPRFYLDSGATPHPMDEDARLIDGFHHTRSMQRALKRVGFDAGSDVHRLVFPGQLHNASSWASRVVLPLQLLFPHVTQPFHPERWTKSRADALVSQVLTHANSIPPPK